MARIIFTLSEPEEAAGTMAKVTTDAGAWSEVGTPCGTGAGAAIATGGDAAVTGVESGATAGMAVGVATGTATGATDQCSNQLSYTHHTAPIK